MSKRTQSASEEGTGPSSAAPDAHRVSHSGPPAKQQKISSHDIQIARETAELFKSNIFKLQIDQLVAELKLKPSHCVLIEKVLHKIHSLVLEVPVSGEVDLKDVSKKLSVKVPFPEPVPSTLNYPLQYTPPSDISLVGSFGLKSAIRQKQNLCVDVALCMDKALLSPKDYLNYRVLYKKAFYLAYLAGQLERLAPEFDLPINVAFEYHNGDKLCPSLKITSKDTKDSELAFAHTNFAIRLLVALPFGVFDPKKMLPDRNCVRIQGEDAETLPPTPLYNASVLSSSAYVHYLKYLHTMKRSTEAFKDAVALGKLWLNQRGLSGHVQHGGFGHFEFSVLMAALLEGGGEKGNKILLHGYSSYQLFKGTIKYLATQDLSGSGYLSFNSLVNEGRSLYKDQGFDVPTVFDKHTKLNVLWKMTNGSYGVLRHFAQQTLDDLNDLVNDRFNQVFILNNTNPLVKFDYTFTLPMGPLVESLQDEFDPHAKLSFVTIENFVRSKIELILQTALGARVEQMDIHVANTTDIFPLKKRKPNSKGQVLFIGMIANAKESEHKLTKGPSHSDEEAGERFASFWGDVAQLRRYKDGAVQWSCLWEGEPNVSTVETIVRYILDRHLEYDISEELISNGAKFTAILPPPVEGGDSLVLPTQTNKLTESFAKLVKTLQRLDLPIGIKNVHPVSCNMRSTAVVLPVAFATGSPDFWNECIIHFDSGANGKWPREVSALEDTKTGMLLKMQSQLPGSFMVDADIVPYNGNSRCLRVVTPEGYGFELRIVVESEERMYLGMIEECVPIQKKTLERVYLEFYRRSIGAIKHHRTMTTCVGQFPMLSATIRLFKLWLDRHMLLCHLAPEIVELLALRVFVDPAYGVPQTPMAGLLRAIKVASEWNWVDDCVVVDVARDFATGSERLDKLNGKLTPAQHTAITDAFAKVRATDPKGVHVPWMVVSRDDMSGKVWTYDVDVAVASRITALAKLVVAQLDKVAMQAPSLELSPQLVETLFTPALQDYDVVVDVRGEDRRRSAGVVPTTVKYKNLVNPPHKFAAGDYVIAGIDADVCASLYEDVRARFEGVVWSTQRYAGLTGLSPTVDALRQRTITGLLRPGHSHRKFRVGMGWPMALEKDETVSLNVAEVLKWVAVLGGDAVAAVRAKENNLS